MEDFIGLRDEDAWRDFVEANREAILERYGTIANAYQHAREGGLTLGGGAAQAVLVLFVD